jgi:hypothetical protein
MNPPSEQERGNWQTSLVSYSISDDLPMDEIASQWAQVQGVDVRVIPGMTPDVHGTLNTIKLKSLHTQNYLYLYARWSDSTRSVHKDRWVKVSGEWQHTSEDEDRFAVLWDNSQALTPYGKRGQPMMDAEHMGRQGDMMGTKGSEPQGMMMNGCALLCHPAAGQPNTRTMSTSRAGSGIVVDLWHWKAARTNPVGFADDQYIDAEKRKSDPGTAAYEANESSDGTRPAFMFSLRNSPSPFLFESVTIPFNSAFFTEGDTIPAYLLNLPSGDRADVKAYGVWNNNYWTVVLRRRLQTNSNVDIQFTPGEEYSFAIAIFNNAGDELHLKSQMISLRLEP